MSKSCGACGKSYRSGTLVYSSDGKGSMKRTRVCGGCAKQTLPILIGTIEAGRCDCGKPMTTCLGCARDAEKTDLKKQLEKAVKKIRGLAKAYEGRNLTNEAMARAEGLRQAADVLESGEF